MAINVLQKSLKALLVTENEQTKTNTIIIETIIFSQKRTPSRVRCLNSVENTESSTEMWSAEGITEFFLV